MRGIAVEFTADVIKTLPPYLFSIFEKRKEELKKKGVDVIDFGIGSPDLPPPAFVIDRLKRELDNPVNYAYSPYIGIKEFRQAVADFYKREYGVDLDPDTEVLTLIGSKEGIVHLLQAVVNPGETVLVPDPGFQAYWKAVHLVKGEGYNYPLNEKNGYQPEFENIPEDVYKRTKFMFLNYPSNPTAATTTLDVFEEAVRLAKKYRFIVSNDSAYSFITFTDEVQPSILQAEGAKEVAVEFGSLSKIYNMAGMRIGYIVGNKDIIKALATLKSNVDTCQFIPIQQAAATALNSDRQFVAELNRIYKERRDAMVEGLKAIGIDIRPPEATFYIWVPVKAGYTTEQFTAKLMEEAGIIVTPGTAFGPAGEGYFRISLTKPVEKIREAIERLKRLDWQD